jgi:hypothetical protein
MRKHPANHWREMKFGLAVCTLMTVFSAQALAKESVRAELIRLQRQFGLTFAWSEEGISRFSSPSDAVVQAVSFQSQSIIRLKDSLQAFRPNRFSLGEYPEVLGIGMCWSHDQTRLAATIITRPTGRVILGILDLNSKQTRAVAINVDQKMYVTSQCWSQDDKRLVYSIDGAIWLYDTMTDRADDIAKGTDPTWSPDGKWIGFRDGDSYYAMHPDGDARKELFRNRWGKAVSGLYWSPDSRIVAYVRELGFLQGGALDAEVNQLRARRLEDGSDDSLCPDNVDWYANYQWITSSEMRK